MEGDRREPPPHGGTDGEAESTCRYVFTYDAAEPPADREERWLLEWCLAWVTDPDVLRVDVDRSDGPASGRLVVHLEAAPEECRRSTFHRRLVDRIEERFDACTVTCHPPSDDDPMAPTYEPAGTERDVHMGVPG